MVVKKLAGSNAPGFNRAVWNLVPEEWMRLPDKNEDILFQEMHTPPGVYTVRLTAGGRTLEQKVEVRDDPRIDAPAADRKAWHDLQIRLAGLIRDYAPVAEKVQKAPAGDAARADLKRQARELMNRLTGLYGATGRWVGRPTADQTSELAYYQEMVTKITAAAAGL